MAMVYAINPNTLQRIKVARLPTYQAYKFIARQTAVQCEIEVL